MIKFYPYGSRDYLGRCTSRDEYGNADINGVDMSFLLSLNYEEMLFVQQALNRLADFEDAEETTKMRDEEKMENIKPQRFEKVTSDVLISKKMLLQDIKVHRTLFENERDFERAIDIVMFHNHEFKIKE